MGWENAEILRSIAVFLKEHSPSYATEKRGGGADLPHKKSLPIKRTWKGSKVIPMIIF